MLHGFPHHRILIPAALASALAFATGTGFPVAARADTAQVTVVSPGGTQQTLSLDALAGSEDVSGRTYALRSEEGESTVTVSGFSLAAIVEAAGADPFAFSYLEVQRPGGGSVLLSRHQALDPGAFPDGAPVIYATAAGTAFLRPSGGPGDLNAADSFEAPQGVAIVLSKGLPLRVRARASTVRTRPGRPVEFSATVEGGGAGEQLIYSWYFDDGESASGESARHAFAERGSYDVVVGVTTPGDSTGSSDVVTVRVGAPIEGPDRKGGGRDKDANAPDHGASSSGGGPGSADPTPATPSSEVSSAGSTLPAPAPHPPTPPVKGAAGERVSGTLVAGSQPFDPDRPDRAAGAQPGARSGQLSGAGGEGGGAGLPEAALGLGVTLGLLGLGALAEARGAFLPSRRGAMP